MNLCVVSNQIVRHRIVDMSEDLLLMGYPRLGDKKKPPGFVAGRLSISLRGKQRPR
jgi:hypothetical protein